MTSHDPRSAHDGESNPIHGAIMVTLGAVAVVIAIVMLANFAVGVYGSRDLKGHPSMSAEAVAKRIAPVAQVNVDPNAAAPATAAPAPAAGAPAAGAPAAAAPPATPAPATPPAAPAKVAAAGGAGKSTYESTCQVCHAAGVAGAPKLGDKAAWAPRIAQGVAALHNSALKGKGAMPAKGGNATLPDDAVTAAVDYMVAAAK